MLTELLTAGAGMTGALGAAALGYRAWLRARAARGLRLRSPQAIVQERFVVLGGVAQWISIRGEDRRNPVLLVLHGGPGSPYSLFTPLLRAWERHFTVVQWDRLGVGKTLGRNGKVGCGELSFERMAEDAAALCELLLAELAQPKLVLLASSAGTPIGLRLAQRRPELLCAFVGTDLNVGMAAVEAVAFPALLAWAQRTKDVRALALLARVGEDVRRWDASSFDQLMRLRDRTVTVGKGVGALFGPLLLTSPQHSLRDLLHVISGLGFSSEQLFAELRAFDARRLGLRFEVPFFVFQGEADVFTPACVAEAYFTQVHAPLKHFELLPRSGHLGAFSQPEPFLELLCRHVLPLASAAR
jgi:pimeloyl-ACP methyl ester carboxylesterase